MPMSKEEKEGDETENLGGVFFQIRVDYYSDEGVLRDVACILLLILTTKYISKVIASSSSSAPTTKQPSTTPIVYGNANQPYYFVSTNMSNIQRYERFRKDIKMGCCGSTPPLFDEPIVLSNGTPQPFVHKTCTSTFELETSGVFTTTCQIVNRDGGKLFDLVTSMANSNYYLVTSTPKFMDQTNKNGFQMSLDVFLNLSVQR